MGGAMVLILPRLTVRPPPPGSRPRPVPCPHPVGECYRPNSGMADLVIRQRLKGSVFYDQDHTTGEGVR